MTVDILPEVPPSPVRRPRLTPLMAAVVTAAVVGGGAAAAVMLTRGHHARAAAGTTVQPTAATIVSSANAAALGAGSAHVVVTATIAGASETLTTDSDIDSGVQTMRVGGIQATVRVLGAVAYVNGNGKAMSNVFALPGSLAGTWIRLTPTDRTYADTTQDVTLRSLLHDMGLTGPLTVVHRMLNGTAAVGVRGTPASKSFPAGSVATLWVPASGTPRPIEYDVTTPNGRLSARFSAWGALVKVAVPTHWVTLPTRAATARPTVMSDADMKVDLRNLATVEETYLTDNVVYATAAQLRPTLPFTLQPGVTIAIHLNKTSGYCLAAHEQAGRFWIYSSQEGGLRGPADADTCSRSMYPQAGGALTGRPAGR